MLLQPCAHIYYVQRFPLDNGSMGSAITGRMLAGLAAGVFATTLTHPMDVVRANLTVTQHSHTSIYMEYLMYISVIVYSIHVYRVYIVVYVYIYIYWSMCTVTIYMYIQRVLLILDHCYGAHMVSEDCTVD